MDDEARTFAPPLEQVLAYPARIKILGALAEATDPLTPTELIDHSGLARSTVYDHLGELNNLEFIEEVGDSEDIQLTDSDGADAIVSLNQYLGERLSEQGDVESEISSLLQ